MKKIILKNSQNADDDLLFKKVKFISDVFFGGFSPTECRVMCAIVRIGEHGMLNMTIDMSKSLTKALNLNNNTLNVSLSRIEDKGALRKNGRVIVFQPVWSGIIEENEYLISFKQYDKT
jgi:hypothetical protein